MPFQQHSAHQPAATTFVDRVHFGIPWKWFGSLDLLLPPEALEEQKINLVVADFLFIMALPFRASYYYFKMQWRFGQAVCNIVLFTLAMNRSGSTFFLMAITVDRYMRVVHPHHPINSVSSSKAMCGAFGLWLFTIAMTAHIFSLPHTNTTYCESFVVDTELPNNLSWHRMEFLFSFIVPLLVILYCTFHIICHLRGRQLAHHAKIKNALCFITLVVVVFTVCFLPSNIMQVVIWIKTHHSLSTLPESEVCPALEDVTNVFFLSISLTYLNSVLDPIIYYLYSPAIKDIFRKTLHPSQEKTAQSTNKKSKETDLHCTHSQL